MIQILPSQKFLRGTWAKLKAPCGLFAGGLSGSLVFAPFTAGLGPWLFWFAVSVQCSALLWAMVRSTAPAWLCLFAGALTYFMHPPAWGALALLGIAAFYLRGASLLYQNLKARWIRAHG